MRRLFIHVGQPKTGSSAIQSFLYSQRAELMRLGYHVPEAGLGSGGGHRTLVYDLLERSMPTAKQGCAERAREELAASPAQNAIISTEFLWGHLSRSSDSPVLRYFRELGFELNVVGYVRDPVELLNSGYAQNVKSFKRASPQEKKVDGFFTKFPALLDGWTRIIDSGEFNVTIRPFTKAVRKDGIVRDFLSTIGVGQDDLDAFGPEKRVNTGSGPIEIAVLTELIGRLDVRSSVMARGQIGAIRRKVREVIRAEGAEPSFRGLDATMAQEVQRQTDEARQRFAQAAWGTRWEACVPPSESDWVPNRFDPLTAEPQTTARYERTLEAAMTAAQSVIQAPTFDRMKQRAAARKVAWARPAAKKAGAEEAGGKKAGVEKAGARKTGAQRAGAKKAGVKRAGRARPAAAQ